jgi:hypothetical protein
MIDRVQTSKLIESEVCISTTHTSQAQKDALFKNLFTLTVNLFEAEICASEI